MKYRNIKEIREDNDIRQTQLASVLNISQNTYSQYETGKIAFTDEILIKLADYYGTSVDFLLDRTKIKEPYPKK